MATLEEKIQKQIDINVEMRNSAERLLKLHKNSSAIADCETELLQSKKNIEHLTERLLKSRTRSADASPRRKKKVSALDLMMCDSELTNLKVSLKLHELEYKLEVEKSVEKGIKNMMSALSRSPSQNRRQEAELKGSLSVTQEKINLLNRAIRKYKVIYVEDDEADDEEVYELDVPSSRIGYANRRPVTGMLQMQILDSSELAHAPKVLIKSPSTIVTVKTEADNEHTYSTGLPQTDVRSLPVNKTSEVEVIVYDQGNGRSQPIGMIWLKIADIADKIRKSKLPPPSNSSAPDQLEPLADQRQDEGRSPVQEKGSDSSSLLTMLRESTDVSNISLSLGVAQKSLSPLNTAKSSEQGIEAWFDVEPMGKLKLRLNFVRALDNRRPLNKLGRVGAVHRREEIHERNGHQFIEKRFYNIMRCALCAELMVKSGYQCADCRYMCHRKCYTSVVTKCITSSGTEKDADEEKLNHRIPHRFEDITSIGANWCCHCGYMLPIGLHGSKKCSECNNACHTKCIVYVPDFCGLSMKMANQMLSEIKAARKRNAEGSGSITPKTGSNSDFSTTPTSIKDANISSRLSQIDLKAGPPPVPKHADVSVPRIPPLTITPFAPFSNPEAHKTNNSLSQGNFVSKPLPAPPSQSFFPNQVVSPSQGMHPSQVMSPGYGAPFYNTVNKLEAYSFLAVLGRGNFGKVMLAQEKSTNNLFAIKVLKKRFIIDNNELESLRSEKHIFQTISREKHPFLVGLESCFQTDSRVYFVMQYVGGGDLMWHIQREPFSERRARFYACEVLLALEYFHRQGVVYRDLKLDNIMLGIDGHVKLADYGLCKLDMWHGSTTGTFCGTPEFMAPEILLEQRYGRAVDWWAFGILVYEMILGQSPFRGEDEDEIFDAILEDEILYPINMSKDAVLICQRLLTRDPKERLGSGTDDAAPIKAHPYFRDINWQDMLDKKVSPPFYPSIRGPLDTSNFDEEFTTEHPALTPITAAPLNMEQQREFAAFSYTSAWSDKAFTQR